MRSVQSDRSFDRDRTLCLRVKLANVKASDAWVSFISEDLPMPQAPDTPIEIGRPRAWTMISATVSATPEKFRKSRSVSLSGHICSASSPAHTESFGVHQVRLKKNNSRTERKGHLSKAVTRLLRVCPAPQQADRYGAGRRAAVSRTRTFGARVTKAPTQGARLARGFGSDRGASSP